MMPYIRGRDIYYTRARGGGPPHKYNIGDHVVFNGSECVIVKHEGHTENEVPFYFIRRHNSDTLYWAAEDVLWPMPRKPILPDELFEL